MAVEGRSEADVGGATSLPMKKKKKKVALPRREWQINPVTRGEAVEYSRSRVKSETRDEFEQ